jgi:NAD(P)-dependent dehydrogenase (short-subunit alcohol dehydrogenase family)
MTAFDTAGLFSVRGRRILVTGASSGLGQHFARILAAAGAEVFVGARSLDKLRTLVAEISSEGGRATAVSLDVVQRTSVCSALDQVGDVDVLVNNAGVSDTKALLDYTSEQWEAIIQTNLTGAWAMAQETAKRMVLAKREGGSIINITSILGSRVAGGVSPYIASKAGLKALTEAMALELARYGIRVNSLAPGYIATQLNEAFLDSEAGQRLRQRIPARCFGVYADLNGALLLLASGASNYMTGSQIVIDGGHLCSSL